MNIPNENTALDLKKTLVNLAHYRLSDRTENNKVDPLLILSAYAQDELVYHGGKMIAVTPAEYAQYKKDRPNDLVNKFGRTYAEEAPLLLHKRLADILVDVAIDLRDRRGQITVVMDGLRTYDSALQLQESRPDLVTSGLLTRAGNSAHNRALAVDSKLFELIGQDVSLATLIETDEHGHLDDLNMKANSRFYDGPISDTARHNRLTRLQAWQRASIRRKTPIANLLSEFWDDRVTGSPADMWRVATCRALCIGVNGDPKTNPIIASLKNELDALHEENRLQKITRQQFAETAHSIFVETWNRLFIKPHRLQLSSILGLGAAEPPTLEDFIFHEWFNNIHDHDLVGAGFPKQLIAGIYLPRKKIITNPLQQLFEEARIAHARNRRIN